MESLPPPPKSLSELKSEAISLGLVGRNPKLDTGRKKLIAGIMRSHKLNRGIGHANMLLFGPAGVGKSTTINHIFDLKNDVAATNSTESETKANREYMIVSDNKEYEVSEVALGIIDSPGVDDTIGPKQDACNLAALKRFFQNHPQCPGCLPNLILILIRAGDNRFDGPSSNFVKSLKSLDKLQIIDKKMPNVVGVITHAASFGRNKEKYVANFIEKKNKLSKVIFQYLEVYADVVALENHPEDFDLKETGDYTFLPDCRTLQPKNLYEACKNRLKDNKDDFGLIALNSAFKNTKKEPVKGFISKAKDSRRERLDEEEKVLLKFYEEVNRGEDLEDSLVRHAHKYIVENKLQDVEAAKVQELTSNLNKLNVDMRDLKILNQDQLFWLLDIERRTETIEKFLEGLGIAYGKPEDLDFYLKFLERGYHLLKDRSLRDKIFDFRNIDDGCGILLPENSKIEKTDRFEQITHFFDRKEEMIQAILDQYDISVKVQTDMFNNYKKAGFNMANKESPQDISFLIEYRMFEISAGDFSADDFTKDFKKDVKNLPDKFKANKKENIESFEYFFNKWGHCIIERAFCGGYVEIKAHSSFEDPADSPGSALAKLQVSVNEALSNDDARKNQEIFAKCQIKWSGGDSKFHRNSTIESKNEFSKWKLSVLKKPALLNTQLSLIPITELIRKLSKKKEAVCEQALKTILGGVFPIRKRDYLRVKEDTLGERSQQDRENSNKRDGTVDDPEFDENCFPGSASLRSSRNGVKFNIEMNKIKVGDLVETKNGYSKVLLFAHYAPNKIFRYLKINTTNGKHVRLSGNHLIFVSSIRCTKLAKELKPGDKLILRESEHPCEVDSVEEMEEVGFYCPITEDGTIYVDGILTSCYASCKTYAGIDGHYFAHLGLLPMRVMNMKPSKMYEMHPYVKLLDKLPLPFRI